MVGINGKGESKVLNIWEHDERITAKFVPLKCFKSNKILDHCKKLIYIFLVSPSWFYTTHVLDLKKQQTKSYSTKGEFQK